MSFKRARCDGILTYFALDMVRRLRDGESHKTYRQNENRPCRVCFFMRNYLRTFRKSIDGRNPFSYRSHIF
ncbi:hypothetical protein BSL056_05925 [Bacillus safensis]|nr:hypothetical protein BSL056_05925 [Bacillus safensis]